MGKGLGKNEVSTYRTKSFTRAVFKLCEKKRPSLPLPARSKRLLAVRTWASFEKPVDTPSGFNHLLRRKCCSIISHQALLTWRRLTEHRPLALRAHCPTTWCAWHNSYDRHRVALAAQSACIGRWERHLSRVPPQPPTRRVRSKQLQCSPKIPPRCRTI